MADEFSLHLDLSEVVKIHKDLVEQVKQRLGVAAKHLSMQTHAHVKEQAAIKLKTRLEMYNENLDFEQIDTNTWAIIVREKGRWIEDGMEPHSMLDDLLKSPKAKRAKDGSKYLVVPFKQNKGPTKQTVQQKEMLGALKQELKKQKIPYGKIERNPDGSPKTGLIHKMDLNKPDQNRAASGHAGPPGRPFGTDAPGAGQEGPTGRPYLWGVRIYQKLKKNPDGSTKTDKKGKQMATREIFTFRVASSKQANSNKWFHPGLAPVNLLDQAYDWAKDQWDNHIAPEIIRDL
jgi:hypothetical protein